MEEAKTFQAVNDDVLVDLIDQVHERLVFIAPGVRKKVAEAICGAVERLGDAGNVSVILDVSEEVCRMGFGDIEGLRILQQNQLICGRLSAQEGVRIGVLITDEDTLIYTPTALLLEAEPEVSKFQPHFGGSTGEENHPVVKPNGILLKNHVPQNLSNACSADGNFAKREIGLEEVETRRVDAINDAIKRNPPKPFDIQRKERVFSSELCYMDLEFTGYRIATRKLELPPDLFVTDNDTRRRLAAKFQVFDKDKLPKDVKYEYTDQSGQRQEELLSIDYIDQQIRDLRDEFLIPTGKFGTVMLRSRKADFDAAVDHVLKILDFYKEQIAQNVKNIAEESCKRLSDEVSDKMIKSPPLKWRNRLSVAKSADEKKRVIGELLTAHFKKEIDAAIAEFNPKMRKVEKGISYETFNDPEFTKKIEKALGADWRKRFFEEHDSAPEKEGL